MAVRLDAEEVAFLDEEVAAGVFASRTDAVRAGVRALRRAREDVELAAEYDAAGPDGLAAHGVALARAGARALVEREQKR